MGESEGSSEESRTVLERYQQLEELVVREFPEIIIDTSIERSPGDTPRNLRVFLPEGFVDIFVSSEKYSFHWQREGKIIRFDNSPHHRNLETFPDHMHKGENVSETVLNSEAIEEKLIETLKFIADEHLEHTPP